MTAELPDRIVIERPVYVYRLHVQHPEGSDAPGWHPEGWEPETWEDADGFYEQEFSWPKGRHCLSASTARRWAQKLEAWGASVIVERSEPVTFPTANDGEADQ